MPAGNKYFPAVLLTIGTKKQVILARKEMEHTMKGFRRFSTKGSCKMSRIGSSTISKGTICIFSNDATGND